MNPPRPAMPAFRPRISLKLLLLLVIPVSAVLALFTSRHMSDRAAERELKRYSAASSAHWVDPLEEYLGVRTIFAYVDEVTLSGESIDDAKLLEAPLAGFRGLDHVVLECMNVTDSGTDQFSTQLGDKVEVWIVVVEELIEPELTCATTVGCSANPTSPPSPAQ